jgi:hypothetical protein
MITRNELQELLQSTETYRVERTTSTGDMDKFLETVFEVNVFSTVDDVTQDVTQGVPQGVPQDGTQDGTQGDIVE